MQKIITILLVFTCLVCILNYREGYLQVFHLDSFIEWFDLSMSRAPNLFSEFKAETGEWTDDFINGLLDFFSLLTFPIRFSVYIIRTLYDFFETFFFYNYGIVGAY